MKICFVDPDLTLLTRPLMTSTSDDPRGRPTIWWNNALFFCGTHLAAAYGVYRRPPTTVPKTILVVTIVLWQLASFGYAYMRSYCDVASY